MHGWAKSPPPGDGGARAFYNGFIKGAANE
jgi:hypothetical protein